MADIIKNGWNEWAKYVLETLKDVKIQLANSEKCSVEDKQELLKAINELKSEFVKANNEVTNEFTKANGKIWTELRVLQTRMTMRAGLTGAITGLLPAIAVAIYVIIKLNGG